MNNASFIPCELIVAVGGFTDRHTILQVNEVDEGDYDLHEYFLDESDMDYHCSLRDLNLMEGIYKVNVTINCWRNWDGEGEVDIIYENHELVLNTLNI